MRRLFLAVLVVLILIPIVLAFAEENNSVKVPEGMEVVPIGASGNLIVPKGAKIRKVGAQIIVEGVKEYVSRRFEETDKRLLMLEKGQAELLEEVKALKAMIEEIKGSMAVPEAPKKEGTPVIYIGPK